MVRLSRVLLAEIYDSNGACLDCSRLPRFACFHLRTWSHCSESIWRVDKESPAGGRDCTLCADSGKPDIEENGGLQGSETGSDTTGRDEHGLPGAQLGGC